MDSKVRTIAVEIGDRYLLCKISNTDLIALEAHYHLSCLQKYYRNAEKFKGKEIKEESFNAEALKMLIDFMNTARK